MLKLDTVSRFPHTSICYLDQIKMIVDEVTLNIRMELHLGSEFFKIPLIWKALRGESFLWLSFDVKR